MDLLTAARAKMPEGVQEVMKSAAAKCAIEHGDLAEAQALLDSVQIVPVDDPVKNFSGIAYSNRAVVGQMLSDAQSDREPS
jgi:hypothetical protein